MNWKKLSEEQPKEEGTHLCHSKDHVWVDDITPNNFIARWTYYGVTHWLKIEPPKEAK